MNVFDYEPFMAQYKELVKIVGDGETDSSTMDGVVKNSDNLIRSGLEYAENSAWASSKLENWNQLMPSLQTQLANLAALLKNAKQAAEAYHSWEAQNQGLGQNGQA